MKRQELIKKFGIAKTKTLRQYVLWLQTQRGTAFIQKNASGNHGMGDYWTCMEFKAEKILEYAKKVVTE